jgi:hypothetical protein
LQYESVNNRKTIKDMKNTDILIARCITILLSKKFTKKFSKNVDKRYDNEKAKTQFIKEKNSLIIPLYEASITIKKVIKKNTISRLLIFFIKF